MFRRRKDRQAERQKSQADSYSTAMTDRLRGLSEDGGYDFDDQEAAEVEARLRRMFYGAKRDED